MRVRQLLSRSRARGNVPPNGGHPPGSGVRVGSQGLIGGSWRRARSTIHRAARADLDDPASASSPLPFLSLSRRDPGAVRQRRPVRSRPPAATSLPRRWPARICPPGLVVGARLGLGDVPTPTSGWRRGLEGPAIPRPDRANTLRTWRCPPLVHLPGGRMRTPSGHPLWGHDLRVPALPPARLHQHARRSRWPSDTSRRQAQSASGLGTGNHQPRRRETEVDALAHVRPPRRTARATGDSIHERVGR